MIIRAHTDRTRSPWIRPWWQGSHLWYSLSRECRGCRTLYTNCQQWTPCNIFYARYYQRLTTFLIRHAQKSCYVLKRGLKGVEQGVHLALVFDCGHIPSWAQTGWDPGEPAPSSDQRHVRRNANQTDNTRTYTHIHARTNSRCPFQYLNLLSSIRDSRYQEYEWNKMLGLGSLLHQVFLNWPGETLR